MWKIRWLLAGQCIRLAVWLMPRSQPRDCIVTALNAVRYHDRLGADFERVWDENCEKLYDK